MFLNNYGFPEVNIFTFINKWLYLCLIRSSSYNVHAVKLRIFSMVHKFCISKLYHAPLEKAYKAVFFISMNSVLKVNQGQVGEMLLQ